MPACGVSAVDVIGLYYQHRVDPQVPIEDTVGAMGELWIALLASSPLGRGFLSGKIKQVDELGARDVWVWEHGGTYFMHYDGAGTNGWPSSQA